MVPPLIYQRSDYPKQAAASEQNLTIHVPIMGTRHPITNIYGARPWPRKH